MSIAGAASVGAWDSPELVSPRKYGLPCAWAAAASDLYPLVYDTIPLERRFVENLRLLLAGHSRVAYERLQVRARAPTRRLGVRVARERLDVLDGRPEQRDEPGRAPRGLLQIHRGLEDVPELYWFVSGSGEGERQARSRKVLEPFPMPFGSRRRRWGSTRTRARWASRWSKLRTWTFSRQREGDERWARTLWLVAKLDGVQVPHDALRGARGRERVGLVVEPAVEPERDVARKRGSQGEERGSIRE